MTLAELHYGVLRARAGGERALRLRRLALVESEFDPLPIEATSPVHFGRLLLALAPPASDRRPQGCGSDGVTLVHPPGSRRSLRAGVSSASRKAGRRPVQAPNPPSHAPGCSLERDFPVRQAVAKWPFGVLLAGVRLGLSSSIERSAWSVRGLDGEPPASGAQRPRSTCLSAQSGDARAGLRVRSGISGSGAQSAGEAAGLLAQTGIHGRVRKRADRQNRMCARVHASQAPAPPKRGPVAALEPGTLAHDAGRWRTTPFPGSGRRRGPDAC